MRFKRLSPFFLALALLPLISIPAARDESAAAVLTAGSGAYRDAFSAFQEEYGGKVAAYDLSISTAAPREEVIVAFGAKAAILDYPGTALLVYCMAPAIISHPARRGRTVSISMVPDPVQALQTILKLQPGIRRLAVFQASGAFDRYLEALSAAGKRLDLEILPARVRSGDDIPAELRRLLRDMDAFWLLPDPQLVNIANFTTLRYFSRANRIPFYAPTPGLAKKGATAAVYNSFGEMGRTAAKAAKEWEEGDPVLWYPEKISYSINTAESGYIRLKIPADVMTNAEALFQ